MSDESRHVFDLICLSVATGVVLSECVPERRHLGRSSFVAGRCRGKRAGEGLDLAWIDGQRHGRRLLDRVVERHFQGDFDRILPHLVGTVALESDLAVFVVRRGV